MLELIRGQYARAIGPEMACTATISFYIIHRKQQDGHKKPMHEFKATSGEYSPVDLSQVRLREVPKNPDLAWSSKSDRQCMGLIR